MPSIQVVEGVVAGPVGVEPTSSYTPSTMPASMGSTGTMGFSGLDEFGPKRLEFPDTTGWAQNWAQLFSSERARRWWRGITPAGCQLARKTCIAAPRPAAPPRWF